MVAGPVHSPTRLQRASGLLLCGAWIAAYSGWGMPYFDWVASYSSLGGGTERRGDGLEHRDIVAEEDRIA